MHFLHYVAPEVDVIRISPWQNILVLSGYGNDGDPGKGFDDDDIIDIPDFESFI